MGWRQKRSTVSAQRAIKYRLTNMDYISSIYLDFLLSEYSLHLESVIPSASCDEHSGNCKVEGARAQHSNEPPSPPSTPLPPQSSSSPSSSPPSPHKIANLFGNSVKFKISRENVLSHANENNNHRAQSETINPNSNERRRRQQQEQHAAPPPPPPHHHHGRVQRLRYNMHHGKRGYALIFSHEYFNDNLQLKPRNGANVDASNLEMVLRKLNFTVVLVKDAAFIELYEQCKTVAAKLDHTHCDCVVVVIMSHGDFGRIYARDTYYTLDDLTELFTADRCSSLAGKPKLFFIQACQGEQFDESVIVPGSRIISSSSSNNNNREAMACGGGYAIPNYPSSHDVTHVKCVADPFPPPLPLPASVRIPNHADFLICQSTIPGFCSWRSARTGSWFIRILCDELNAHGRQCDLLTILTRVNLRVALEFESTNAENPDIERYKQIPCIFSTLTREINF